MAALARLLDDLHNDALLAPSVTHFPSLEMLVTSEVDSVHKAKELKLMAESIAFRGDLGPVWFEISLHVAAMNSWMSHKLLHGRFQLDKF